LLRPALNSSGVKVRPYIAATPKASKNPLLTRAPGIDCGSAPSV
jgi:hypothetical protein